MYGRARPLGAAISDAVAAGSTRLFSLRHDFPTEWAKFQAQVAVPNQRFELKLTLRPEHYPFWSQGRLNTVNAMTILARVKPPAPTTLDIFDKIDDQGGTAAKDTLARDASLGNLLAGKLKDIALPDRPDAELKLYFVEKEMADLWIAVTWS